MNPGPKTCGTPARCAFSAKDGQPRFGISQGSFPELPTTRTAGGPEKEGIGEGQRTGGICFAMFSLLCFVCVVFKNMCRCVCVCTRGWFCLASFFWLVLFVASFVFLLVSLFACLLVCLFVCLLACLLGCLFVCLFACLVGWLVGWLVGCCVFCCYYCIIKRFFVCLLLIVFRLLGFASIYIYICMILLFVPVNRV